MAFLAGLEEGYHSRQHALFHQQLVKLVEVLPVNIEHYSATILHFDLSQKGREGIYLASIYVSNLV
jgi:hypothetical protein